MRNRDDTFCKRCFTAHRAVHPNSRDLSRNPKGSAEFTAPKHRPASHSRPNIGHESVNQDTAAGVPGRPEPKSLQLGTSSPLLGWITGGSETSNVASSRDHLTSVCITSLSNFSRQQPKRLLILALPPMRLQRSQQTNKALRRLPCPSLPVNRQK